MLEVENQLDRLDKWAQWHKESRGRWQIEKARKKMEAVTYKTYCKGHDHCMEPKRAEAKKIEVAKSEKVKGNKEASGSKSRRGKWVEKKSLGQLIFEQKDLAKIRAEKEKELRLKQKEETEAALQLGNVWGVQNEMRQDQTKRMLSKILHKKRET